MPTKILISACLYGQPVRYDGSSRALDLPIVRKWREEGKLVAICPEMAAGFTTPRLPAEIENGMSGHDVLAGRAKVIDRSGKDVTDSYVEGAQAALRLARENDCSFALLIDGSPSCGSLTIYDGTFSGTKTAGEGVTAALLRKNGIEVFSDATLELFLQAMAD